MKINRIQNTARNMVYGYIMQVYYLITPFIMRTAIIYLIGVEYLGLSSLFTSILSVLNLAELGAGSAMVYSMYKPLAEDDTEKLCQLMYLYRKYYRIIGIVIAALGMAVMPFLKQLIHGDVPDGISIYALYLLNLGTTVLSYWLFAYKNCLLYVHQREDVNSKLSMLISTMQYIVQICVLYFLRSYYAYLITAIIMRIISNCTAAVMVSRLFPQYRPKKGIGKDEVTAINHRIGDLFTSKLGGVILNQVDTIVISAFLGLTVLAVYHNYFSILSAVTGVMTVAINSAKAGIGNSLAVEDENKNFADIKKLTFITAWFAGFCSCCFLCLYQPFMKLWVGEKLMLDYSAVICLCIYFYVLQINRVLNLYKDTAGLWHEDRFRPFVTAMSNLVMNLVTVRFWGIYGVILSTVIATVFIGMPWLLHNLFTVLFDKKELSGYICKLLFYTAVTAFAAVACILICSFIHLSAFPTLIIRAVVCCIIPNVIFLLTYRKKREFKEVSELIECMTNGRIKLKRFCGQGE